MRFLKPLSRKRSEENTLKTQGLIRPLLQHCQTITEVEPLLVKVKPDFRTKHAQRWNTDYDVIQLWQPNCNKTTAWLTLYVQSYIYVIAAHYKAITTDAITGKFGQNNGDNIFEKLLLMSFQQVLNSSRVYILQKRASSLEILVFTPGCKRGC